MHGGRQWTQMRCTADQVGLSKDRNPHGANEETTQVRTIRGYFSSLTAAHVHHPFLRIRRYGWAKFEIKAADLQMSGRHFQKDKWTIIHAPRTKNYSGQLIALSRCKLATGPDDMEDMKGARYYRGRTCWTCPTNCQSLASTAVLNQNSIPVLGL